MKAEQNRKLTKDDLLKPQSPNGTVITLVSGKVRRGNKKNTGGEFHATV